MDVYILSRDQEWLEMRYEKKMLTSILQKGLFYKVVLIMIEQIISTFHHYDDNLLDFFSQYIKLSAVILINCLLVTFLP